LYLKAHYPLEFFCGTLMCEAKTEKIKEYKLDAVRFGRDVRVKQLDINLSKDNFTIQKDENGREDIYYGMSNLKGIGEGAAEKIIALQPYTGIRDFLERFGTDAKVSTALILLDVFPGDRQQNFKYYEFYKSNLKKMADRDKRHIKTNGEHYLKLEECLKKHGLLTADMAEQLSFDDGFFDDVTVKCKPSVEAIKDLVKLRADYRKFKEKYVKKVAEDYIPSIDDFNPENVEIEEKWQELLSADDGEAEKLFYGFEWIHDLEKSPDYQDDHTFEDFRNALEKERLKSCKVETKLLAVETRTTKAGKPFYSLKVEDAVGEQGSVTVWQEDFERFAPEFQPGALLGLRLEPPHPPFPSYTLLSPPRQLRWRLPAKENDIRVIVLRKSL
jgi:DNA polymerase III alpha subunit